MDENTKILTEIQTDIRYIREMVRVNSSDHKELETEVGNIKVTLVDHIAKVKGFGILLGIVGSMWTVLRMLQI